MDLPMVCVISTIFHSHFSQMLLKFRRGRYFKDKDTGPKTTDTWKSQSTLRHETSEKTCATKCKVLKKFVLRHTRHVETHHLGF